MNFDASAIASQPRRVYGADMPKGPQGQKRPADAIGLAVLVGKIATGEVDEPLAEVDGASRRGRAGGLARAGKLSNERKTEIASKAAHRRWVPNQD